MSCLCNSIKCIHVRFNSLINFREFFEPLLCVGNCSGHRGESSEHTVVSVLIKLHSRVSSHILVGSGSSLMCGIGILPVRAPQGMHAHI